MFHEILVKICRQENIELQVLSRGWLFRLEKAGQVRYIFNNHFALNSQSSANIAADKFATFEVLRAANLPTIDHAMLYPFDNHLSFAEGCNTLAYLENFFQKHHQDIVLKPNHGLGGQGITHITSPDQFPDALTAAFASSSSASLCPFYQIHREYRIIMLDGEPRLVYGKERGDDWRFNLQHGSTVVDVEAGTKLHARLVELACRAAGALNLRFCSVDIIELDPSDPHATEDVTLLVIEINSTVAASHYLEQRPLQFPLVEDIYRDAVLKMFE